MPLLFAFALLAFALLAFVIQSTPLQAQTLRIATFNTELSRKGPGLLLRDIERDNDAQIQAVVAVISQNQPDILVLQGIDWDHDSRALKALEQRLAAAGSPFPHLFARQPNTGLATELDLDGDQRLGGSGDSQGYGDYTGRSGMAVLSRYPIMADEISDLSGLLWRDIPGATLPRHPDGSPFPTPQAQAVQRLSTTAHWALPVALTDDRRLTLLVFKAPPPLFDGAEDRNGVRNADEIRLWQVFLAGQLPKEIGPPPSSRFLIAGGAHLDPDKGAGHRQVIANLLQDPRLQDPRPGSALAGTDTVDWGEDRRMRVDYLLPSRDLQVVAAGVDWPDSAEAAAAKASRHRLVWVDIALD
ncbi:endonuclease/exonuclease/phosphatase family protein [Pseudophaeobacter leonis]|uniref:endonuclease/exonuclease/phosphatase family protein n=1 Tax=Pseudophaeobacter leonis TaxID=1144477 RepID=UPI0009F61B94|nr:endonuclease/exonuclease/phosphatase family protein [Pseudophaeobacter leonis]